MNIDIAVSIDRNYLQHLYVLLESIIEFKSSDDNYMINVLHTNLDKSDMENLKTVHNGVFEFYFFEIDDLQDLYINAHISIETYYRILLPSLLPLETHKVLYLDCDMVVNHDLRELWETDISSNAVAAVFDYKAQDRKVELNIPTEYDYFNAGVLLINLDHWRNNELVPKLLKFIRENPEKLLYWDQDALNALLYDKVIFVPAKWNVQSIMLELTEQDEQVIDAIKRPSIIHFTGASKPWHISSKNPYKDNYLAYLKRTPYANFELVNQETKHLIQKKGNIFIWGAGPTGASVYNYLHIDIKGFVDSDSNKWGTDLMGKKIFNIDEVKGFPSLGIIVCSGHYREISAILRNIGLIEGEHFVQQM